MKFYLASGLGNINEARRVIALLEAAGHVCTYDWTKHGSVKHLGADTIRRVAVAEAQGVRNAEVVIVLLPGGRGTHVEIGIAVGFRRPIIVIHSGHERDCAFYYLPGVIWVESEHEALGLMEALA